MNCYDNHGENTIVITSTNKVVLHPQKMLNLTNLF